jgi:CubicO group peptidase (beta-lactamase class C family)
VKDYAGQLESAVSEAGVTGASFAYWDGGALHTAVAGWRNSVTRDPVTPDTAMHIGSITKLLNAVMFMQLVDDGLVAPTDPVAKHLPELRLLDMKALERITCAMLINHTSGIDCDILPDHGPDEERIVDAIARCANLPQLHPPGEQTSYCNVATVIAGYLAQQQRKTSWYSLIKGRIYEPLEMRHAIADLTDLPRFRNSIGDLTDLVTGQLKQTTRPFLPLSFAPCGTTLMMSAADLVTFARALVCAGVGPNGSRILSSRSAALMKVSTASIDAPRGLRWGLGWLVHPNGVLSHSGGGPGIYSILYADPASGRALALLTNCDKWEALNATVIDPILQTWGVLPETSAIAGDTSFDPANYAGIFENNIYRAEVFSDGDALNLRMRVKTAVYDNARAGGYPAVSLISTGEHGFEANGMLPGFSKTEVRFVGPLTDGRFKYLAFMFRLLARTH